MDKDRTEICKIISHMLDNPDSCGIYSTSTAFNRLEYYIEKVRLESIGWTHAYACILADHGDDVRVIGIPDILKQALTDLSK